MAETLTIQQIINILLRRWKMMFLSAILCAALALGYTVNFIDPLYISNASLYVKSRTQVQNTAEIKPNNATITDIAFASMLADTYAIILKSDRFMNIVLKDTGVRGYTTVSLKNCIDISPIDETEVLKITVTTTNPETSRRVAQSVIENAEEEILRIVEVGSVKIIDDASMPKGKSSPNNTSNTILGGIIGVVLAAALSILVETLDTSVRGAEDLENNYNIPVLGIIPAFDTVEVQQSSDYSSNSEGGKK